MKKRIFTGVTSLSVAISIVSGFALSTTAAETATSEYGLGDIGISASEENTYFSQFDNAADEAGYESAQIASSVDLSTSSYFPPIGNQGSLGSCVSWASTYYQFTYEANKLNNITTTSENAYSPAWMFNMLNGGENKGSTVTRAYDVLTYHGALKMSDSPYNYSNFNYAWSNNTQALVDALRTRVTSSGTISIATSTDKITYSSDSQLNTLKKLLCAGKIVTVSVSAEAGLSNWSFKDVYSGGNTGDVAAYRASSASSGHLMTIVGYNNNITCDINGNGTIESTERGAFKVANSWETNWKNNGYVWVMYDALNFTSANTTNTWESSETGTRISIFDRNMGSTNSFYYINVENKIVNLVGLVNINTQDRYKLNISIGNNSIYNTIFNSSLNPNPSASAFNGTLVVDYLDYDDNILEHLTDSWGIRINNASTSYAISSAVSYTIADNKLNSIKTVNPITSSIGKNGTLTRDYILSLQLGDVDYVDGITNSDSSLIQQYCADMVEFSDLQMILADFNENGSVEVSDAILILQYIAENNS